MLLLVLLRLGQVVGGVLRKLVSGLRLYGVYCLNCTVACE